MGELCSNGQTLCRVQYHVRRYQGMIEGSGLPIPGLHRIEGAIHSDLQTTFLEWIGAPLSLRLDDGRALGITLADAAGRIFSEGHGPLRCQCC